eukprot:162881_1
MLSVNSSGTTIELVQTKIIDENQQLIETDIFVHNNIKKVEQCARIFGTWIHEGRHKWVNTVAYLLICFCIVILGVNSYNKVMDDWTNFKQYPVCIICICRILWFRFKFYPIWNDNKKLNVTLTSFFADNNTQRFYKIQMVLLTIYFIIVCVNAILDIIHDASNEMRYLYEFAVIWCYNIPTFIAIGVFQWYFKIYDHYLRSIFEDLRRIQFKQDKNGKQQLQQVISEYLTFSKQFIIDTQNKLKYSLEILLFVIIAMTIWDNVVRSITFWHMFYSVFYSSLILFWFYPTKCMNDTNKKFHREVLDIIEQIRCDQHDSDDTYLLTQMILLQSYCTVYSSEGKIGGIKVTHSNLSKVIGLFIVGKVVNYVYHMHMNS